MVVTQGGDARGMSHWSLWFGIRRELDTSEHREWISIPNSVVSTFYSKLRVFIPSLGFPDSSVGKESTCNAGDSSLIPGSGKSAGEGLGYPLQYSGLENSRDYSPGDCKESDVSERLSLSPTQDRLKRFYTRWPKMLKYSTILPNLWTDFQGSWDPWSIFRTGPFKFRATGTYRISHYCLYNYSSSCYYNLHVQFLFTTCPTPDFSHISYLGL